MGWRTSACSRAGNPLVIVSEWRQDAPQFLQKGKAHVDSGICVTPSSTSSTSYCRRRLGTSEDGPLDTVEQLRSRELELENAMKQPGGARVTQEHELQSVRRKLVALNTATLSDTQNLRVLRCSLADFIEPKG